LTPQKFGNYCIVAYVENHVEERSGICIIITDSNGEFSNENNGKEKNKQLFYEFYFYFFIK